MIGRNRQFVVEDVVMAAIMMAVGIAGLLVRLDVLVVQVNLPAGVAWLRWWPLVPIVAGLVMLIADNPLWERARVRVPARARMEKTHGL